MDKLRATQWVLNVLVPVLLAAQLYYGLRRPHEDVYAVEESFRVQDHIMNILWQVVVAFGLWLSWLPLTALRRRCGRRGACCHWLCCLCWGGAAAAAPVEEVSPGAHRQSVVGHRTSVLNAQPRAPPQAPSQTDQPLAAGAHASPPRAEAAEPCSTEAEAAAEAAAAVAVLASSGAASNSVATDTQDEAEGDDEVSRTHVHSSVSMRGGGGARSGGGDERESSGIGYHHHHGAALGGGGGGGGGAAWAPLETPREVVETPAHRGV